MSIHSGASDDDTTNQPRRTKALQDPDYVFLRISPTLCCVNKNNQTTPQRNDDMKSSGIYNRYIALRLRQTIAGDNDRLQFNYSMLGNY
ncbi:hypothetical protein RB195_012193 [Necator americanus]|uniref:Uncharacterized protein n=1 Tax=Necator americanus TaxID=51031 RepID=A0ABR1D5Z3_NECAM